MKLDNHQLGILPYIINTYMKRKHCILCFSYEMTRMMMMMIMTMMMMVLVLLVVVVMVMV